jgi:hypothetical protein
MQKQKERKDTKGDSVLDIYIVFSLTLFYLQYKGPYLQENCGR